ncbi:60S ribosomal protein L12-like [Raphanus sativus]|uniref:60S ribosomal protein L12-like n=1 Tax=Raphanus sativus TaxID=3726 RepID=A0A9W3DF65_RAPSA|nr:60S ribosomal protein L12-like [Raphanus sativus]
MEKHEHIKDGAYEGLAIKSSIKGVTMSETLMGQLQDGPLMDQNLVNGAANADHILVRDGEEVSLLTIARIMRPRSIAKELSGTVREILGTCVSVGYTVDVKDPKHIQQEIKEDEVEIPGN